MDIMISGRLWRDSLHAIRRNAMCRICLQRSGILMRRNADVARGHMLSHWMFCCLWRGLV